MIIPNNVSMKTWYISVCVGGESIMERSFNVDMVYQCVGGERLVSKMFLEVLVRQDRHWFWRIE